MITNKQSGTNIHEIADGIYRINTPIQLPVGAFSFNQYLIVDDQPMLFHTGPRRMFPLVQEAIAGILPPEQLSYIGFSHYEADECGSLNEFLAVAPESVPVCSQVAAIVSVNDVADRAARAMADGEVLDLGRHALRWFDTPHLPHGWECGLMFDDTTRTLMCGDLFTQGGEGKEALVESDILGPSEAFRGAMDYYAHTPNTELMLERLAQQSPATLACMHGSAWRGDGAALLRALSKSIEQRQADAG
ncbi:MAG: MBL fold metallo-hydrolase [Gammaproteobacteria bacterium]|nr:MBL fold metallo-hydrolase [Gammaproteobacteria bacterium]